MNWVAAPTIVTISLMLIQGFSGFFWNCKKINFCVYLFSIISILLVIPTYIVTLQGDQITKWRGQDQKQQEFAIIQSMYDQAQENLCKSSCECFYYQNITARVEEEVINYSNTDNSLAVQAQQCSYFPKKDSQKSEAIGWIEEELFCSGWCTNYPILMFTNVNNQINRGNCYYEFVNYYNSGFSFIFNYFALILIYTYITLVLGCCFLWHPDKSQSKRYKVLGDERQRQ